MLIIQYNIYEIILKIQLLIYKLYIYNNSVLNGKLQFLILYITFLLFTFLLNLQICLSIYLQFIFNLSFVFPYTHNLNNTTKNDKKHKNITKIILSKQ